MKRILCAIVISLLYNLSSKAQSAEWIVAPQYSSINYFAPNMYKISKDGKVGIISVDGRVILQPIYDAINYFYEGKTIFVNRTSNGWQVKGSLNEDETVNYTNGEYFLLSKYKFFSEGYLPVRDKEGLYGYLDDKCQPTFEFIKEEVHPFSEGFAVVGTGDTFHWVNTSGEQILPRLKNGGTPYGGSNFYNGLAYLWDEDGVFFLLDSEGKTRKIPSQELEVDYLYRVGTGLGENVEYQQYKQTFEKLWSPKEQDGLWTYVSQNGKLLTPFQYDEVLPFSAGVAIAEYKNKYGLLKVVEDNSIFSTKVLKANHVYSPGSNCVCEFELSVPEKWRGQNIAIEIIDPETGNLYSVSKKSGKVYSFIYKPSSKVPKENKKFKVVLSNNGTVLWRGVEQYNYIQRVKLTSSIRVNNADANSSDRCYVTATIKNPSSIPVTTTVTLSGGGSKSYFDRKTATITIPAYGVKSITSSFRVKHVEFNGWCAVTTTDGTSSRRNNIELKPF